MTNRITQVLHVKFTHSLTLLPYKTSIRTKQQIFRNRELVDVKLSELTTVANFIQVRDNPSSNGFIVTTTTTTPKLTVPPFTTNETTTDPRQPESPECGLVCAEGGGRDRRTSHFLLSYYSLNLFVLPP